jgi:hypothetical protein
MRRDVPIRPDVHQRFIGALARAEARLDTEQRALARRYAAELAREHREQKTKRPSRNGGSSVEDDKAEGP